MATRVVGSAKPHVVTLGGGSGHSRLLSALSLLECRVTALVSVADDGGCSGRLRDDLGIPPPGDVRRCLAAMAQSEEDAESFESRLPGSRSLGNLELAELCFRLGDLQKAADDVAGTLGTAGRVCPLSLGPCTLEGVLPDGRIVVGETAISAVTEKNLWIRVRAPAGPNPLALQAILDADYVVIAPGSFYTSTLAALLAPGIADALLRATSQIFAIPNLCAEDAKTAGFRADDYAAEIEKQIRDATGGATFDVVTLVDDGTMESPDSPGQHVPAILAERLGSALGLPWRPTLPVGRPCMLPDDDVAMTG